MIKKCKFLLKRHYFQVQTPLSQASACERQPKKITFIKQDSLNSMKRLIFTLLLIIPSSFLIGQESQEKANYVFLNKYIESSPINRVSYLDSIEIVDFFMYDIITADLKAITGIDVRKEKVFGLSSIINKYYVADRNKLETIKKEMIAVLRKKGYGDKK